MDAPVLSKADKAQRWKYEVEDAVHILQRAQEIKAKPKLLKAAQAMMLKQAKELKAAAAEVAAEGVGSALMQM